MTLIFYATLISTNKEFTMESKILTDIKTLTGHLVALCDDENNDLIPENL